MAFLIFFGLPILICWGLYKLLAGTVRFFLNPDWPGKVWRTVKTVFFIACLLLALAAMYGVRAMFAKRYVNTVMARHEAKRTERMEALIAEGKIYESRPKPMYLDDIIAEWSGNDFTARERLRKWRERFPEHEKTWRAHRKEIRTERRRARRERYLNSKFERFLSGAYDTAERIVKKIEAEPPPEPKPREAAE